MIIFLVCLGQLFLPDVCIRCFRACVFYLGSINNLRDRFSSCFLPFPFSKSPCARSNVFYLWIAWEYYHWISARKKKKKSMLRIWLQCRSCRRLGFNPWDGKVPWRMKWQPTPVFLTRESHGQRSLAGYSPGGHRESDTTEQLNWQRLKLQGVFP